MPRREHSSLRRPCPRASSGHAGRRRSERRWGGRPSRPPPIREAPIPSWVPSADADADARFSRIRRAAAGSSGQIWTRRSPPTGRRLAVGSCAGEGRRGGGRAGSSGGWLRLLSRKRKKKRRGAASFARSGVFARQNSFGRNWRWLKVKLRKVWYVKIKV